MSHSLGNVLPPILTKGFADRNFHKGCIIKIYCYTAQKEKLFIYMDRQFDGEKVALVHINTEINENFFPSEKLKKEHVLILAENNDCLDHDSFVNCTQIIERYHDEIYNLIENDVTIHKGQLNESDYKIVREKIVKSRLITPAQKKTFGLFYQ